MLVNLMHDNTLSKIELNALSIGAAELKTVLPELCFIVRGSSDWVEVGEVISAPIFFAQAKRIRRGGRFYIDVDDLVKSIVLRPRKNSSQIDIVFTSEELAHQRCQHFLQKTYGVAMGNVSVQSVAPYRNLCNTASDVFLMTKLALMNEVGRLLGALDYNAADGASFCKSDCCAMGEAWTFQEMLPLARRLDRQHEVFCPECMKAIRKHLHLYTRP